MRAVAGDGSDALAAASSGVEHRIVFTPSGLSGTVAHGTTVLDAARRLGADLDTVCGGRGICGRCQVVPGVGSFAKWAITVAPDALGAPAPIETDYHGNRPLRRRPALGLRGAHQRRRRGRRAADAARSTARSFARISTCRRSPSIRRSRCCTSTASSAELGSGAEQTDCRRASWSPGRVVEQHGRAEPTRRFGVLADLQPALKRRRGDTVAVDESDAVVAIWPGFVDSRVRRRRRHRVDHDRRPPVRPHVRRGARQRRTDEPADPLRRGPDEPGLVRDDEPGR